MADRQTAFTYAQDQMQQGKMTAAQANVLAVQIEGVRLVTGRIPADVRKALNEAVKAGELGHLKKDGLRPEAYFHKNGRSKAIEARNKAHYDAIERMKGVFA